MRISLNPSFILHQRPYRETSLLLDVLTRDHGRIALIARGVKQTRSPLRPLLQCFYPLLLSWQGKNELMTLHQAEPAGLPLHLQGECLLSGFYLNELLVRLLQKHDPHPQLYTIYHETLLKLQGNELNQQHLRLFEKKLLEELGYGFQFDKTVPDGQTVKAEHYYRFFPDEGFRQCAEHDDVTSTLVFSGKSLIALAQETLNDTETLRDAKRLMRITLSQLLGNKTLNSRKLFKGVTLE